MRKIDECDIHGRVWCTEYSSSSREKTIANVGDRWWPQAVKQERAKINRSNICNNVGRRHNERPMLRGVSIIRSCLKSAPSRKGCVVDGQMTKASNK